MHTELVRDFTKAMDYFNEYTTACKELIGVKNAITIFGSARGEKTDPLYINTRRLGYCLGCRGYDIITGGGGSVMEAGHEGARLAGRNAIGLNIELPFEQKPNKFQNLSCTFDNFNMRQAIFLKKSKGFIACDGGFGTLYELFEVLTKMQCRKMERKPVVLFGTTHWQGLVDWFEKSLIDGGRINKTDLALFKLTDDVDEAVKFIVDNTK